MVKEGCSAADIVLVPEWSCDFDDGTKCGAVDGEKAEFMWQQHTGNDQ
jgi:hypothetical protein